MLAYGTGTFTVKDFLKAGIPLTIVGYILVIVFGDDLLEMVRFALIKNIIKNLGYFKVTKSLIK